MEAKILTIEEFTEYLNRGEIPPTAPESTSHRGFGGYDSNTFNLGFQGRKEATDRGMWAIVTQAWVSQLAEKLQGQKVLEVMAGAGWLAKALSNYGIRVTATDSGEWDTQRQHSRMRKVYNIETIDGVKAVKKYSGHDVLIISWPPYDEKEICRICQAWGQKPIIYIGETEGGCNAPREFWSNYHYQELDLPMMSWPGIHDYIYMGTYGENSL